MGASQWGNYTRRTWSMTQHTPYVENVSCISTGGSFERTPRLPLRSHRRKRLKREYSSWSLKTLERFTCRHTKQPLALIHQRVSLGVHEGKTGPELTDTLFLSVVHVHKNYEPGDATCSVSRRAAMVLLKHKSK